MQSEYIAMYMHSRSVKDFYKVIVSRVKVEKERFFVHHGFNNSLLKSLIYMMGDKKGHTMSVVEFSNS